MNLAEGIITSLLLRLIISLHLCSSSSSTDTLSFNESLADGHDQVLVSNGESYTLGFFTPGNSSNRYLGIWYTKVSVRTVVWVANRDHPINDTSGLLSIDGRGDIILRRRGGNALWSTNVSAGGNSSTTARLLDEGNFVLLGSDGKTILWQSFDHLTDTIFPNMKFGLDLKTGLNRSVQSWKSLDDPATGDWSYDVFPDGLPQLMLHTGRTIRRRIGPWNGIQWNGVPHMFIVVNYNTSVVSSNDETTFSYGVRSPEDVSRMYVDPSGFVKITTWNNQTGRWVELGSSPTEPCDYYRRCGPNGNCDPYGSGDQECSCLPGFEPRIPDDWYFRDGSGGCVRKRSGGNLTCTDGDGFVKVGNAKIPDTSTARLNAGMDLEMCERECLSNCSCTAYASSNLSSGIGCVTMYGDLMDTRIFSNGGQDLYVRVDAIELAEYVNTTTGVTRKTKVLAIVLSSVGGAIILAISIMHCLLKRKRNGRRRGMNHISPGMEYEDKDSPIPTFDVNDIFSATRNFAFVNKLGQGGFGSVYKGVLSNGQEIAIKRLSQTSKQGIQEFKNEVQLVSELRHKNLARLFGCSIHGEEKMLIYEYLPNRSLDFFIFDETKSLLLDWKRRFDIIIGIARGILYLHQDSRLKIIHRDLKPSNVLLDAAMNPKISDFGMAKLVGEDQMEANTNRVVGTYGYMSPEYAMEGLYSTKSDVFSFGVLTLEIVSSRRSNKFCQESPSVSLIGHVWDLWREGSVSNIVNSSTMGETYSEDQVIRCIQIALLCIQESPIDRPTMSNVVFMLGNATPLPSPKKPAFILLRQYDESNTLTSPAVGLTIPSTNGMSITTLEAR